MASIWARARSARGASQPIDDGRRQLFCIRCAKGRFVADADYPDNMREMVGVALAMGWLKPEDVRRRECKKREDLIDALDMRHVCPICGRHYALLMKVWQGSGSTHYGVCCSAACALALSRRRRKRSLPPRDCPGCSERFTPKRRDAVFCSGRCRVRAHRSRHTADDQDPQAADHASAAAA